MPPLAPYRIQGRDGHSNRPDIEPQADGNKIELADIQVGDRVRIVWSTRADGGVAHKIIVLEQAKK